jgi:prolyl-tRNA editing enzyme YbaK/EbsC (Cys-tRNA(Pro) deacylase)
LDRADPAFVRDRTGFAIGGVAPVGHSRPVRTLIDVTLAEHLQIWAAAGHPRSVFATSYAELLRLTGGSAIEVA